MKHISEYIIYPLALIISLGMWLAAFVVAWKSVEFIHSLWSSVMSAGSPLFFMTAVTSGMLFVGAIITGICLGSSFEEIAIEKQRRKG